MSGETQPTGTSATEATPGDKEEGWVRKTLETLGKFTSFLSILPPAERTFSHGDRPSNVHGTDANVGHTWAPRQDEGINPLPTYNVYGAREKHLV